MLVLDIMQFKSISIIVISLAFSMFSDSDSIREGFKYPSEDQEIPYYESGSRRNQVKDSNSGKFILPKDRFYFKLKVIKNVGQLVANLKSSIALSHHGLKEQEVQYLEGANNCLVEQPLWKHNNIAFLMIQSILMVILAVNLWKNTFELVMQPISIQYINYAIILLYAIYIGCFINTEIKNEKHEFIVHRGELIKQFIQNKLWFEAIIIIALIFQLTPLDQIKSIYYSLRILLLLTFFEIKDLYKNLENIITIPRQFYFFLRLSHLLLKIGIFLHCVSLFLSFVRKAELSFGETLTWIQKNNLAYHNDIELYFLGWYWASTILSTVGFGDIVPANNLERFIISFIEVLCAMVFGFFVNYIGSLIKLKAEESQSFQKQMRRLNNYLNALSIPNTLKTSARAHYLNKNELEKIYNHSNEEEILANLNQHLRNDIKEVNNVNVLKVSNLVNKISIQTIKKISVLLKKVVYVPEQLIYSKDSKNLKLWIIEKGAVEDRWGLSQKDEKIITKYNQEQHKNILGWVNLLKEQFYTFKSKAKTFSILYELDRADFFKIVKENSSDFFRIMQEKQQMMQTNKKFEHRCVCCDRFTHSTINCPKIHFHKKNAKFLMGKINAKSFNSLQFRNKKNSRSQLKFNWKFNLQTLPQYLEQNVVNSLKIINQSEARQSIKRTSDKFKIRCSVEGIVQNKKSLKFFDKVSKNDISFNEIRSNSNLIVDKSIEIYPLYNFDQQFLMQKGDFFSNFNYNTILKQLSSMKVKQSDGLSDN